MNAGTSATITNLTAPTNANDAARKIDVDNAVAALVDSAPDSLNTLNELAAALADDDDAFNTLNTSIATKLPKAGGTMTGAIAMSTNKITGAGDPTSAQDLSTKAYTDAQRDTRVAKTGDTMSGALAMGNNKITGLATPTANTDVTNKIYVDGILGSATVAATSATNAATSETNAATSATSSANSAAAALVSKNAAATSLSTFQNQYLGAQSSAPTQDPDGSALDVGDLYFDTVANAMKVYSSSGWTNAGSSVNGTSNRVTYTATAGQTVFAATYDSGYLDAFLNGVKLLSGTDFTATNGTSITLASGASVNDVVDIVAYGTFELADHYTRTASDARYVEVAGDTMTGNLSFGDNDKAIFGAGSDLEISSNGASAIIRAGNASSDIRLESDNRIVICDRAFNETFAVFNDDDDVKLYHNNAAKLATTSTGIDVTGTVEADGFQTGTSNTTANLLARNSSNAAVYLQNGGTGDVLHVRSGNMLAGQGDLHLKVENNGDISFYEDTGTTAKFFWDASAERLGIGTTSPQRPFHLNVGTDNTAARFQSTDTEVALEFIDPAGTAYFRASGDYIKMGATQSDSLTILDGGNVGIGNSSPDSPVEITTATSSSSDTTYLKLSNAGENVGHIDFENGNGDLARITGTKEGSGASANDGILAFSTAFNSSFTERMRIDSSGNVLVGKTGSNLFTVGAELTSTGQVYATASSAPTARFNRKTSDGEIVDFRKDDTTVGSIGTVDGDLNVFASASGHKGLRFGNGYIAPTSNSTSIQDATTDLGLSTHRFKDLYLSGGVYLGGTGSANKLDDYEEGLHTYTLKGASSGSATIPIRNGYTKLAYTKIGRMVTITGKIETLGSHSATGALRLSLPFTAANLTDQAGVAGGSCFVYRTSQSIYDNPAILPSTADPYAIFYYNTTSGDVATINANNLDAQFEILVSFSYFTNA